MTDRANEFFVVNLDGDFHSLDEEHLHKLERFNVHMHQLKKYKETDQTDRLLKKADAILFTSSIIDRKFFEKLQRCRIIIRFGTGIENVDIDAATEKGIMIVNVVDFCTEEVSNHTIMLLLACCRKLREFCGLSFLRKNQKLGPMGSIAGETLGLIGFGRIARSVAIKAKCFGMNILVFDPCIKKDVFEKYGVKNAALKTLLKESDYVSLHCPLNRKTYHIIGKNELRLMKKTAYLINTARGKLLDEKALVKALKSNRIAGAGLDVFEKEPPDRDNPLLHMDNVIYTPHYAYYSDRAIETLKKEVVDELVRFCSGKIPKNLCNPEVLKKNEKIQ